MQQTTLYNSIHSIPQSSTTPKTTTATAPAARPLGLLRRVARQWELVGVLALMGSSAAYGVFALAHLGL